MKKTFFLTTAVFVFLLNIVANAQELEYDKKTGIASVAGVELFKMEEIKSPTWPGAKDIFIKNMAGKELMFLKMDEFSDPQKVSSSDPKGKTIYFQVNFLEDETKAEINHYVRNKKIADIIHDAKLIVNGELDEEAQEKFIMVNGNRFTQRRNEINNQNNNNKVIIIDNSNNQPAPRNGLNININR